MNDVVVGLDIGTSSTKAVAVSADGVVRARASASHTVSLPQPGWVEQDAEATWWEEPCRVLREIIESLAGNHRVRPLRPAILYGIDSRAGAEVEQLNALLGEDNVLARGGSALTSQAAGPKLLWLRVNELETW